MGEKNKKRGNAQKKRVDIFTLEDLLLFCHLLEQVITMHLK